MRATIVRLIAVTALLVLTGGADTLRLRNGSTVSGSYLGGSPADIQFLTGDEVRHYDPGDVLELAFGASAPSARVEAPKVEFGPDIAGVPFLRDSTGYMPLERAVAARSRSAGMLTGPSTVYRMPGGRSPVRVHSGDPLIFVVRMESDADPSLFQLYRLDARKDFRQTRPTTASLPSSLPITIRKVAYGVYNIVPALALVPGEYAISPNTSKSAYCFGVN